MPDINASLNEGRAEAKNSCEEEAKGLTQSPSRWRNKVKHGSGDGKNKVVMTINLEGLINEIVIDRVKCQMVPLGNGDGKPKSMEVVKKTPVTMNETKSH